MGDHELDFDRSRRTGLNEAVLCEGKSAEQLRSITESCIENDQSMLFTRLEPSMIKELGESGKCLDYDEVSRTAVLGDCVQPKYSDKVAVITGGSADVPVAKEVIRTLEFHGCDSQEFFDVGVAGLWRLQDKLPELREFPVLVCVAGMDAALPTVLGGLVSSLVIAVPSSTGYGRSNNGETALNALLCSCSQGLVVVNIDNGFGAACAAIRAIQN